MSLAPVSTRKRKQSKDLLLFKLALVRCCSEVFNAEKEDIITISLLHGDISAGLSRQTFDGLVTSHPLTAEV